MRTVQTGAIKHDLVDCREPGRIQLVGAVVQVTVLVSSTNDAQKVVRTLAVVHADEAAASLGAPLEEVRSDLGGLLDAGRVAEQVKGVIDTWNLLLRGIG